MKQIDYAILFGKIGSIIGFIYAIYRWFALQISVGVEHHTSFSEHIFNLFPLVLAGLGMGVGFIGYVLDKLILRYYFVILGISIINSVFLLSQGVYLARMSKITTNDKIGYLFAQYFFDTAPLIYFIFIIVSTVFWYRSKV
ncbi:hypothetical protein [Bacillus wiedmannii]|uniref:hypothetical protein n=1 Tax=Bacillus wiedmannii TaxID=1890302 RepID=UPI000BEC75EC|nr:hypothetical protein [Bacillus wiedmannii]PEF37128.1 hypothetical protein CON72_13850 [Bacillus wiedmannii]